MCLNILMLCDLIIVDCVKFKSIITYFYILNCLHQRNFFVFSKLAPEIFHFTSNVLISNTNIYI